MAKTVEITGDEQVIRDLRAKGTKALHLKPVMGDIADFAERQITPTHHNRTGALTRSLYGGGDQLRDIYDSGFRLGTTVDYARFVFRGTKHMKAQPPRVNTNAIARDAARRINQELERA